MNKLNHILTLLAILIFNFNGYSQINNSWFRYSDSIKEKSGYKDVNGNIMIPPKFNGLSNANVFNNIMAVNEFSDSTAQWYYLLKNGSKVCKDSVFTFDFTFDCENEEKIIYKDHKKNGVGFLNKNGVAIIPAIYNVVTPFRNGIAVALRNAKQKCWGDKEDTLTCEHRSWIGGETVLINEKNEILADSLPSTWGSINWYSKKENEINVDTSISIIIKGKNDINYSFIDYTKEFNKWFYNDFVKSIKLSSKIKDEFLFDEVNLIDKKVGLIKVSKISFFKNYAKLIKANRFDTAHIKSLDIINETLDFDDYEKNSIYKKYFTDCGLHNESKFPVFIVRINYIINKSKDLKRKFHDLPNEYETQYTFLRTENGFKLLNVPIK